MKSHNIFIRVRFSSQPILSSKQPPCSVNRIPDINTSDTVNAGFSTVPRFTVQRQQIALHIQCKVDEISVSFRNGSSIEQLGQRPGSLTSPLSSNSRSIHYSRIAESDAQKCRLIRSQQQHSTGTAFPVPLQLCSSASHRSVDHGTEF